MYFADYANIKLSLSRLRESCVELSRGNVNLFSIINTRKDEGDACHRLLNLDYNSSIRRFYTHFPSSFIGSLCIRILKKRTLEENRSIVLDLKNAKNPFFKSLYPTFFERYVSIILLKGFSGVVRSFEGDDEKEVRFDQADTNFFNYKTQNNFTLFLDENGKQLIFSNKINKPVLFMCLDNLCPTIDHILVCPPKTNESPIVYFIQSTVATIKHTVSPRLFFTMLVFVDSITRCYNQYPIVNFLFAVPDSQDLTFDSPEAEYLKFAFKNIFTGVLEIPVTKSIKEDESEDESKRSLSRNNNVRDEKIKEKGGKKKEIKKKELRKDESKNNVEEKKEIKIIEEKNEDGDERNSIRDEKEKVIKIENSENDKDLDSICLNSSFKNSEFVHLINCSFPEGTRIKWDLFDFVVYNFCVKMVSEKKSSADLNNKIEKAIVQKKKNEIGREKYKKKDNKFVRCYNNFRREERENYYPELVKAEKTNTLLFKCDLEFDINILYLMIIHLFVHVVDIVFVDSHNLELYFSGNYYIEKAINLFAELKEIVFDNLTFHIEPV
jgi:flagellar biosynthesis GTPase FlhF